MKQNVKRLLSALLVLCMVLGMAPVTVFAATEYTAGTAAELQEAITYATDGDTIKLTANIDADMSVPLYTGEGVFNINGKDITINGDNHTINAINTGDGQILNIVDSNVIINNLTVNGNSTSGVTKTRSGINIVGQFETASAQLNGVTVINTNGSGVTVNSATVTANGLTVNNNGWYSVNVHGKYNEATFTMEAGNVELVVIESDAGMTSNVVVNNGTVGSIQTGSDAGTENVTVNNGTVTGDITADSVTVNGGTVVGDITADTVMIKSAVSVEAVDTEGNAVAGVISCDVTELYNGETGKVTVTVPEGYALEDVVAGGNVEMTIDSITATADSVVYVYQFTMPMANVEVKAVLTKADYTVTYMVDGKIYKIDAVANGGTATAPAAPTKEGYSFAKWVDEAGNDVEFTAAITSNVTYTAEFTADTYTITYIDADGASQGLATDIAKGETFTAPAALESSDTKSFLGWMGNDGKLYIAGQVYTFDLTKDLVLSALYSDNSKYFLVNFYDVDGSIYTTLLMEKNDEGSYTVTMPDYQSVPATSKWSWYKADGTDSGYDVEQGVTADIAAGDYFVIDPAASEYYNITTEITPAEGYLHPGCLRQGHHQCGIRCFHQRHRERLR